MGLWLLGSWIPYMFVLGPLLPIVLYFEEIFSSWSRIPAALWLVGGQMRGHYVQSLSSLPKKHTSMAEWVPLRMVIGIILHHFPLSHLGHNPVVPGACPKLTALSWGQLFPHNPGGAPIIIRNQFPFQMGELHTFYRLDYFT